MKIELASTPVSPAAATPGDHPCPEVDLFPTPRSRVGPRFDDTVGLPIDTPRRLDAVVHAASSRLRALPAPAELSHRTLAYRARLQQILREAVSAQRRLDAGSYGRCLTCTGPISLALLTERPWRQRCVYCDLDL